MYMALAGFVMSLVTIKKGLKHIGINFNNVETYTLALAIAVLIGIVGKIAISRLKLNENADRDTHFGNVEKVFCDIDGLLRLAQWHSPMVQTT